MSDFRDKQKFHHLVPVNTLTEPQYERLMASSATLAFGKGDCVFQEDNRRGAVLYLLDGSLSLVDVGGSKFTINASDPVACHPLEQSRYESAIAESAVSILQFNRSLFDSILAWDQSAGYVALAINEDDESQSNRDWKMSLLRSPLFFRLPPANILRIFDQFHSEPHQQGDVIVSQDEPANCCYVIAEGACDVSVREEGDDTTMPVAVLNAGDWFGEEGLLADNPRNASVSMRQDGTLMRLDKTDFDALMAEPVVRDVSLFEAESLLNDGASWLDVRTQGEFSARHLRDAVTMPLDILRHKSRLLDANQPYIVCCDTGKRSATAAFLLSGAGKDVYVLRGGLNAHADAIAPYYDK